MLRYKADRRTVAYLTLTVTLSVVQWNLDSFQPLLYALGLFMGVTIAVISHNHNHLGIWKNRYLNLGTNMLLAMYYGTPTVAWVPTHNQTHHKLNFRDGDTSKGPKFFKGNHLLSVLVYPTLCGLDQGPEIVAYVKKLGQTNRKAYWMALSEFAVFGVAMLALLLLDWKKALIYFVIPQQFSLFMIQVFNYVQHVEAGTGTEWNHSRNFVSPVLNALLFNNGYHTVHHWKPGIHWSQTPAVHAEHADKIHPALLEKSWWGFMIRSYLVRPFVGMPTLPDYTAPHAGAPIDPVDPTDGPGTPSPVAA